MHQRDRARRVHMHKVISIHFQHLWFRLFFFLSLQLIQINERFSYAKKGLVTKTCHVTGLSIYSNEVSQAQIKLVYRTKKNCGQNRNRPKQPLSQSRIRLTGPSWRQFVVVLIYEWREMSINNLGWTWFHSTKCVHFRKLKLIHICALLQVASLGSLRAYFREQCEHNWPFHFRQKMILVLFGGKKTCTVRRRQSLTCFVQFSKCLNGICF